MTFKSITKAEDQAIATDVSLVPRQAVQIKLPNDRIILYKDALP